MDLVSTSRMLQRFTGHAAEMLCNRETGRGRDRQHYHGLRHSLVHVADRVRKMMNLAGATPRERMLGRYTALGHDWIQEFDAKPDFKNPRFLVRVRRRGPNEEATAVMVTDVLEALNAEHHELKPEEICWIGTAIRNTFPAWHAEAGTIWQPTLHAGLDRWNKVEWAVAVADLATPGCDPIGFLQEGEDLALEEQFSITEELEGLACREHLPVARQEEMTGQLIGWFESQAGFARGRKELFKLEAARYPAVLEAFTRFDESIVRAEARVERLKRLSFWDLVQTIGFTCPMPCS